MDKKKCKNLIIKNIINLFAYASVFLSNISYLIASSGGGSFNAGELIFNHILDSYEIHFATLNEGKENEKHLSLPLPVILYSKEQGFDIFLSSVFHHGTDKHTHDNIYKEEPAEFREKSYVSGHEVTGSLSLPPDAHAHGPYILYKNKIYIAEEGELKFDEHGKVLNKRPLDLSITKNVFGVFLAMGILLWLFLSASRSYRLRGLSAPKGAAAILEPLILFIRDEIAKPSIGMKYEKFMPYLLTLFFFILICNLLGLIPFIGGFNITGNIAVTLTLAAFTFLIISFNGKSAYWAHIFWPPGVPKWLYPLFIPIEIIGVFNKPIVLMLRLFANITAGHIIILSFVCLIFIFYALFGLAIGYGISLLSMIFSIFMNLLELLVAFLQAYVFTLLSALYIGQALEEHHQTEEAHSIH